jgi:hypothetical protein
MHTLLEKRVLISGHAEAYFEHPRDHIDKGEFRRRIAEREYVRIQGATITRPDIQPILIWDNVASRALSLHILERVRYVIVESLFYFFDPRQLYLKCHATEDELCAARDLAILSLHEESVRGKNSAVLRDRECTIFLRLEGKESDTMRPATRIYHLGVIGVERALRLTFTELANILTESRVSALKIPLVGKIQLVVRFPRNCAHEDIVYDVSAP